MLLHCFQACVSLCHTSSSVVSSLDVLLLCSATVKKIIYFLFMGGAHGMHMGVRGQLAGLSSFQLCGIQLRFSDPVAGTFAC